MTIGPHDVSAKRRFDEMTFRENDVARGGQNSKRRNVERPIFRNFKIANIEITEDELIDNFIFEFNFHFLKSFEHRKYLIIFQVMKY